MNDRALDENYRELAMAIIKSACTDYLHALRFIRNHPGNETAINTAEDCERFFQSDWFCVLADNLDGPELMKMLQEKERKEAKDAETE